MKLYQFICVILLSNILGCHIDKINVIINGKIIGDKPEKVDYTIPINGICYLGFKNSVRIDSLGNFQIKIEAEQAIFIKLFVPGRISRTLIIEPGENYDICFDFSENKDVFLVNGRNEVGQNLYNKLPNPIHIQLGARKFINDTLSITIKNNVKKQKEDEISKFKTLLDNGKISKDFFKLIQIDRNCYYSALTATVPLIKFIRTEPENIKEFAPEMFRLWNEVFISNPITQTTLVQSPWWYSYAENNIKFKGYKDINFNYKELMQLNTNGTKHTYNIYEAKKNLSGKMLEYFEAAYIYIYCLQKKYEKEFISIFEQYRNDFPTSSYIKYLEPMVNPIVEYHKIQNMDFNKEIKFIENYKNINSLAESVKSLKGKKIYVDVWATWCGPCKTEFKYNNKLKRFLNSNNIEMLYISIDRDDREEQWKQMIKYYDLKGLHIRANKELKSDLERIFDKNDSLIIPWYILIGENGNILKKYTKRPSEIEKLIGEIYQAY